MGSASGEDGLPSCNQSLDEVLDEFVGRSTPHFCSDFKKVPYVFLSFSVLSAASCLLVFTTYSLLPRLRHGGYSSRVFIYRTALDFLIAIAHIVSSWASLTEVQGDSGRRYGCIIVGAITAFALMASNLWYLVLAVDLLKAIRNPFSAAPTYGVVAHTLVWGTTTICVAVLAAFGQKGLGLSMFYWCWISVESDIAIFVSLSLFTYYLPHTLIWVFSTVVLVFAFVIFWGGRFAASSETRAFVMKQNVVYVLVLGIETGLIIPLWLVQLGLADRSSNGLYFYTDASFGLAVAFAVIHSLRGTVDLVVWWVTFSIGPKDFQSVYNRVKLHCQRKSTANGLQPSNDLHTPLIKADTAVNRALRRDAIYCINVGILDAVSLNVDQQHRERVGSVREPFVAQAMVLWDEENRQQETEERYSNPFYREQTERKITFPHSASIQKFAFQDIEPTVFHLLRDAYSISSTDYRQSFKMKNAAFVESSGMLEKFTEGKSGSFFYFSYDFRYIIKTVTSEEEKFLRKIAYRYYNHMKKNPSSLIVRFFGLHKVRLAPEQRYITVVVMENVFYNRHQLKVHYTYDLKGSTVGRRALKGGRTRDTYRGTLKDLDLDQPIVIGPEAKAQLMEQLQQDVEFLTRSGIMDYSLLLGIHNHSRDNRLQRFESESINIGGSRDHTIVDVTLDNGTNSPFGTPSNTLERMHRPPHSASRTLDSRSASDKHMEPHVPWYRRDMGGLRSHSPLHPCSLFEQQEAGREASGNFSEPQEMNAREPPVHTYFFGVVDILQEYNVRKRVEHFWKTKFLCQDKKGLSAVHHKEYGERFLGAMDRIFQ